jgi:hypothetical protein
VRGKISEVVVDIGTIATPPVTSSGADDQFLWSPKEGEERADFLSRMSLAPFTARIVSIAMLNPETGRGKVWYDHPGGAPSESTGGTIECIPASEPVMLAEFWSAVRHYRRLITFNGRSFDCPFLMLRSAMLGVPPSRNLMTYRFSSGEHCDLLDQLTFYGATRKFTLETYCRGFGIAAPGGESGRREVSLFAGDGRYREIAEHAARTVTATAALYERWRSSLSFGCDESRDETPTVQERGGRVFQRFPASK